VATGNMEKKLGEVQLCGFQVMSLDRQTNRHIRHNTSYPSWVKVNMAKN